MLKLEVRGKKKTFWIVGTAGRKRIRQSAKTSIRSHAEIIRAKLETELGERQIFGAKRTCTFAEAAVHYLTQGGEARFMSKLLDEFGLIKIADITSPMVADAARRMYPDGGPAYLVRVVYTPLHATIRKAAKADMCELKIFDKPKVPKREATDYATDAFLMKLLADGLTTIEQKAVVLLMAFTGARDQEALSIEWHQIDFTDRSVVLSKTKNGDPRRVKLADVVIDALIAMSPKPSGRIFGYSSRYSLIQMVKRACKRAGLDYLSPHEIGRHGFAARLLAAGHNLKMVQEAGGWKTIRIVAETYGHLERSKVDDAISDAGSRLAEAMRSASSKVIKLQRPA